MYPVFSVHFVDKQGDDWGQTRGQLVTSIQVAFGNKQTHCKLLRDTGYKQAHFSHIVIFILVTRGHIV